MRRFAVMVAIFGACGASWAVAAPFDQLSNRLQQYDEENGAPRQTQGRNKSTSFREDAHADAAEMIPVGDPGPNDPMGDCSDDWHNTLDSGPPRGFWGRAEALYWWTRGSNTPPLVTTSPDTTPQNLAGILPNATTVFGGQPLNQQGRSGGRFTLGYWFDDCQAFGVENTFLFLANARDSYRNTSDGSPILARPFFNVLNGQQDADLIAFPNVVVGSINATTSRQVLGNEVNMRRALYVDDCHRLDMLAGYRFFHFAEGLNVSSQTTSTDQGGSIPIGTQFSIVDSFGTRNQFNGGQLGLNSQYTNGRWTVDFLAKVALGAINQRVQIGGNTTVTVPNTAPVSNAGGILALGSNSGTFNRNQFSVLPEFGTNLRYQLTPLWRMNVGYTFMLLTNVVRPGDQIDTRLDPNQFPPPGTSGPFTFPTFAFHNSDVWMQGINWGIECDF